MTLFLTKNLYFRTKHFFMTPFFFFWSVRTLSRIQ